MTPVTAQKKASARTSDQKPSRLLCKDFWYIYENILFILFFYFSYMIFPDGNLRLPEFLRKSEAKTWQACQPYVPAAFTPTRYSWYLFLLEAESTPGLRITTLENSFNLAAQYLNHLRHCVAQTNQYGD